MIAKYVRARGYKGDGKDPFFTIDKEYIVIGLDISPNNKELGIRRDSDDCPALLSLQHFDIIDQRIPPRWLMVDFGKGYYCLDPQEFTGDFWDLYHDGDPAAEQLFEKVYRELEIFHGIEPAPIPVEPVKEEHPFAWSDKWLHED